MTMPNVEPDASLYDDDEREMLESLESAEWQIAAGREARLSYWRKAFRAARLSGGVGPVPYDVPYPWGKAKKD